MDYNYIEGTSLGCCKEATPNKKQETKMNYMNTNYAVANCCTLQTEQKQEKMYMVERMEMLKDQKSDELRVHFGLDDEASPKTAEDFLQRIKDGRFTLRDQTTWLISFYDRVKWRDPSKEEDFAGYDKAKDEMLAAFADTMDEVVVLPEIDGLAALNEFKAQTFH